MEGCIITDNLTCTDLTVTDIGATPSVNDPAARLDFI